MAAILFGYVSHGQGNRFGLILQGLKCEGKQGDGGHFCLAV